MSRELFNRGPLVRAVTAAVVLAISIGVFAIFSRDVFGFWLERIALSDEPWPRRVHLEVVGFPPDAAGQRTHKLAQDDDFELLVHASTNGYEVPDEVEIRFRLADGRRGRDTLIRVGEAAASRDDFQLFRYEFKHVAGDMEFDVVGGDDRVRDLQLQVVDRPELFRDRAGMRLSRILAARAAPAAGHRRHANPRRHAARASRIVDQAAHRRPHSRHRKTNKIPTLELGSEPDRN